MLSKINWKRVKDGFVNVVLSLIVLFGVFGVADAIYQAHLNQVLIQHSITTSNRHHAQQQIDNAEIKGLLHQVASEAAAIRYEGGVIVYQDAEIREAQQQGHNLLMAVDYLQQEINADIPLLKAGINNGQAEINAYLHWLGCVGTNSTNVAVCGPEPPLPKT